MHALSVLHVTPYTADAWAYGGIPRLADAIARGLAARGHAVTVCATDVCDAERRLPSPSHSTIQRTWPAERTPHNVVMRVFPNLSNRLAYRYQCFLPIGLRRYLRQHASSFDVAHLHACRNLPGTLAARHLERAGVPYVLAPNGTAPNIERRAAAKQLFDLALGRRTMQRASRVLAVSNVEHGQLAGLGVHPDRIRTVPNPIDLSEFSPPPERGRFRGRLPIAATGPLIVFLGKLTPRKRVDLLVRAFATMNRPDASLILAGNDMGTARQVLDVAEALGVSDRTIFTGLVQGRDRLELLADADVVVYPSEHEIFGLVPLEAILAGTPVVVANDSGCGEVIASTGGGLVVPGEIGAISSAIEHLLDAPQHWRAAAAEAARRVRAMCDPDVVCAQLEQVYEEMVADR